MDRILKRKDLTTERTDPDASRAFKYWLATFQNFVDAVAAASKNNENDDARQLNKRRLLVNFMSTAIYP